MNNNIEKNMTNEFLVEDILGNQYTARIIIPKSEAQKEEMKQALDAIRDRRKYLEGYDNGFNDCLKEMAERLPEHISELSPEVKEAMEKLKNEIAYFKRYMNGATTTITRIAEKLINALDKQFKVNETSESVDVKEEEVNDIFDKIRKAYIKETGRKL